MTEKEAIAIAGKISASKKADLDGVHRLNLADDSWAVYVKVENNIIQIGEADEWPTKVDEWKKNQRRLEKVKDASKALDSAETEEEAEAARDEMRKAQA